eukprot:TRINITY_DN631_c0_g1_i1.p1 TRINITY_DN631_c0_g1~~TRINITY_DN631_c0_g1_i1.p1  ORF type:complete len:402 (+),score=57.04 TRINITY_DN631_c0_g1_i1:467-1672(+)
MSVQASSPTLVEQTPLFAYPRPLKNSYPTPLMPKAIKPVSSQLYSTGAFKSINKVRAESVEPRVLTPTADSTPTTSDAYFMQPRSVPLVQLGSCQPLKVELPELQYAPNFNSYNTEHENFVVAGIVGLPLEDYQGLTYPFAGFITPIFLDSNGLPIAQIPFLQQKDSFPIQFVNSYCLINNELQLPEVKDKGMESEEVKRDSTVGKFASIKEDKPAQTESRTTEQKDLPVVEVKKEPENKISQRKAKKAVSENISSNLKKTSQSGNSICKELIVGQAYEARNVYKSIIRHMHTYTKKNKIYLRVLLSKADYTEEQINNSFETILKYSDPNDPKEIERNTQIKIEGMLKSKSTLTHILREVLKAMLEKWNKGRFGQLAKNNSKIYYESCMKFLQKTNEIIEC